MTCGAPLVSGWSSWRRRAPTAAALAAMLWVPSAALAQGAVTTGANHTGTIAAAPAVINAVVDALSHLGVKDVQMPATPERVWNAIQEVRS